MKPPQFDDCKYMEVNIDLSMATFVKEGFAEEFHDCLTRTMKMVNCTSIKGDIHLGSKSDDGSYSGALGYMVREEINYTIIPYMLGVDADPPVSLGPVIADNKMGLLVMKPDPGNGSKLPIDSWLTIFDALTYKYLLINFFVYSVMLVVIMLIQEMPERNKYPLYRTFKRSLKSFIDNLWKIYQHVLLIYSFDTPTLASKILASFFSVGMFFLISGYFLSLTSTDMVASKRFPYVDSVNRLVNDDEFKHVNVVMPGGLWQENALKHARHDSNEFKVGKRVDTWIKLRMDTSFVTTMLGLYNTKINKGTHVGAVDIKLIKILKSIGCQMIGSRIKDLHICSDTFSPQTLVNIVSKSSDIELLNWVKYYNIRMYESGLFMNLIERAPLLINMKTDMSYTNIALCVHGDIEDPTLPDPMDMEFISHAFYLLVYGTLLALILLLFEKLRHKSIEILDLDERMTSRIIEVEIK